MENNISKADIIINKNNINTNNTHNHYPTPTEGSETKSTPDEVFEVQFPDLPSLGCGGNTCSNNHTWPLIAQLATCPVCKGSVLIMKMSNCPFCNEPSTQVGLTAIFTPSKSITPPCKQKTKEIANEQQELVEITIERSATNASANQYADIPVPTPQREPNW